MFLDEPIDVSFSIPDFPLELRSIRAYQSLLSNTMLILNDRRERIEQLLYGESLLEGVEEALRSARGKIMIITKNNLSTFSKLISEARNDKQGIHDLSGFWSLIHPELIDVQKACEKVEKHRRNRGRLSISSAASSPRSVTSQPARTQIPAPRQTSTNSTNAAQKKPTPSRSTPGLRKFLASKRREQSNILGEHNF